MSSRDRWPNDPDRDEKLQDFIEHEKELNLQKESFDGEIRNQLSNYEKKEFNRWEKDGYEELWKGMDVNTTSLNSISENEIKYLSPQNIYINPNGQVYLNNETRVSSKSNSIHFIPVSIAKLANHLILDMSDLDNSQISIVRKTISLITEEWYDGPKALIVWGRHTIEDNNFSIDNKENRVIDEIKNLTSQIQFEEVTKTRGNIRKIFSRYGGIKLHNEALEFVLTNADIPKEVWPYFGKALQENDLDSILNCLWEAR